MTYEDALMALADPTRRAIYEQVRQGPRSVGELVEGALVSQPAVSQHLRVLERAGLVRVRRSGTRRIYSASREGLVELRQYVESLWDDVLTAYAAEADNEEDAGAR